MGLKVEGDPMRTQLRSWWQRARKSLSVVGIVVAVALAVVVIVAIIGGYLFHGDWTGLSKKTLWDWLQLLVVPVMLAIGGFWLNQIQKSREETIAFIERTRESDRQEESR